MLKFRGGRIYKPKNKNEVSNGEDKVEIQGIVKNKPIDLNKKMNSGVKNSNIDLLKNTLSNIALEPKTEKKKRIVF